MSYQFSELADQVAQDGIVSPSELQNLRQLGWGDGQIHREEAEAIFAINRQLAHPTAEWVDFFVEAVAEFVLNGSEPREMCSEEEAQWLVHALDHDGRLDSMAELEVLVRIVERARNVPDSLKHYALRQIEQAVLTGTGPTRHGGDLSATHISAAECRIVRRLIFASGGHGPAAVTRYDAEMLFRLKDETLYEENAPQWDDLFVDGVANYLKGFHLQNAQLSHERVKELESFVADNSASVGRFFGAMAKEMPQVQNHFGKVFGKKPEGTNYTEAAAAGNLVTDNEQEWLEKMIDADGEVDDLERALLSRIIDEG
ncbi:hypothetical protein P7228_05930 [Altererythrobacter arenosus]|uniref:Tellurite resistance protein TerB n=1 Tax=Altererythrobacter arenosus TaxID=3032592 RepID=A0ABY8FUD2_9SPHN|nr:hypothetical protein [Altererythrobacter sp. CAU 1644]WFL78600.1 hypothetical protein P7228_05930 [Altererythrobacter sp. CAU 1644]